MEIPAIADISSKLAKEFNIRKQQAGNVVELIDEGNTVPFIARYRKEATGGLSDDILRDLCDRLAYLRNLDERKNEVIRLIDEQGKLTEELQKEILKAEVLQRVEDLYKPFKQKKSTRASKAREKGLEPLAVILLAQEQNAGSTEDAAKINQVLAEPYIKEELGVASAEEALAGACDIIAEIIADDPDIIAAIREKTISSGILETEAADSEEKTVYDMYYGKSEAVAKIPNHRILAVNRGEKEKKLKIKLVAPVDSIIEYINSAIIKNERSSSLYLLQETAKDAYKRLISPSIEREVRNMLTERAETEAIKIFAKNTEKLLMTPPVNGARIIAIDPGFRTGCKVAVINDTGKLLAYTTVYPTEPKKDISGTEATLDKLINKYNINTIVIGNGTASRETEEVVAGFLAKSNHDVQYTIVNEAGASVYSASELASKEYPELDVTTRGAMSLGRRLQDPLAELVKISPKSIGVGQYQHDINQNALEGALKNVVENCVNRVGVDLNTASPSLLSYIAGVSKTIADNIVKHREENGKFEERKQLLKVAKLGPKTYNQCVGFMRIQGGKNPLDATSVHPESYEAAKKMMEKLDLQASSIGKADVNAIDLKIKSMYKREAKPLVAMAEDLGVGAITLSDIIEEIKKPARDPRDSAPPVIFRNDVKKFEDLKEGMELTGTVRNVVDFGAFIDIGIKNDGLVHISQMSDKFIKHPMDVVSVGDTVEVTILSIDYDKERVGLSMRRKGNVK
ncbi:MAG: Tex family protein [Eubacteriales bacterium]|nr:Tex family protein [Eubacteriales bacterium]MDD4390282.1 Tex family protein [Eubacteriales bacterium]